jgi:hypothetical protein
MNQMFQPSHDCIRNGSFGATGTKSWSAHLHMEISIAQQQNPMDAVQDHRLTWKTNQEQS